MLEFTAACGFLFAVGGQQDLLLYGFSTAVLALWSLRLTRTNAKWTCFNWLLASSAVFLGLACFDRSLQRWAPSDASVFWMLGGCGFMACAPIAAVNGLLFFCRGMTNDTDQSPAGEQKSF